MSIAYMTTSGDAEGHVSLLSTNRMVPREILIFHPEIQRELDEIEKKGWKYLYVEAIGTSQSEITLLKSHYKIKPALFNRGQGMPGSILELSIDQELPKMTGVSRVDTFRVNVCSKSFPRAATIDLAKNEVSYLHDPFWKWEADWEVDEKKLSDAMQVYDIAVWLIEEKKFKLTEELHPERFSELSYRFKKILEKAGSLRVSL